MHDTTVNGLRASIKALEDVVAPAVDAGNPLAVEQLKMTCAYLSLAAQRLDSRHARLRFETAEFLGLACELAPHARGGDARLAAALDAAVREADAALRDADAPEDALRDAACALSRAASALVRTCAAARADARADVERAVLRVSKRLLDARRAWFAPLGVDPDPGLPPLSRALRR